MFSGLVFHLKTKCSLFLRIRFLSVKSLVLKFRSLLEFKILKILKWKIKILKWKLKDFLHIRVHRVCKTKSSPKATSPSLKIPFKSFEDLWEKVFTKPNQFLAFWKFRVVIN